METEIAKIFSEIIGKKSETVDFNTSFRAIKDWDSLKQMEFIVRIEEKFNVVFTGEEIASFVALKDVTALVGQKKSA